MHLLIRLKQLFTAHPASIEETYLIHLWFTLQMATRFFLISSAILIHGLFPFLFTTTASRKVAEAFDIMKTRTPKNNATPNLTTPHAH